MYYVNGTYASVGTFPEFECEVNFANYAGQNVTLRADFQNASGQVNKSFTKNTRVEGQKPSVKPGQDYVEMFIGSSQMTVNGKTTAISGGVSSVMFVK